jgi:hypothetical protein
MLIPSILYSAVGSIAYNTTLDAPEFVLTPMDNAYLLILSQPNPIDLSSEPESDYACVLTPSNTYMLSSEPTSDYGTATTWSNSISVSSASTVSSQGYAMNAPYNATWNITSWSEYNGASGDGRSLIDNQWYYGSYTPSSGILNSIVTEAWAEATLANPTSGAAVHYVDSLTYYYAVDSTNYRKKARYIDLYLWNGSAFVLHKTWETTTPVINGPSSQTFVLDPPAVLKSDKIRIRARCGWPDIYLWMSEIIMSVRPAS